jgi:hypothetical protein
MGLQHPLFPLHGVQFHPESFLTSHGFELAANFLSLGKSMVVGEEAGSVVSCQLSVAGFQ